MTAYVTVFDPCRLISFIINHFSYQAACKVISIYINRRNTTGNSQFSRYRTCQSPCNTILGPNSVCCFNCRIQIFLSFCIIRCYFCAVGIRCHGLTDGKFCSAKSSHQGSRIYFCVTGSILLPCRRDLRILYKNILYRYD